MILCLPNFSLHEYSKNNVSHHTVVMNSVNSECIKISMFHSIRISIQLFLFSSTCVFSFAHHLIGSFLLFQGEIPLPIPRLHVDFPVVICEAPYTGPA